MVLCTVHKCFRFKCDCWTKHLQNKECPIFGNSTLLPEMPTVQWLRYALNLLELPACYKMSARTCVNPKLQIAHTFFPHKFMADWCSLKLKVAQISVSSSITASFSPSVVETSTNLPNTLWAYDEVVARLFLCRIILWIVSVRGVDFARLLQ